jgi:hypothetical protein
MIDSQFGWSRMQFCLMQPHKWCLWDPFEGEIYNSKSTYRIGSFRRRCLWLPVKTKQALSACNFLPGHVERSIFHICRKYRDSVETRTTPAHIRDGRGRPFCCFRRFCSGTPKSIRNQGHQRWPNRVSVLCFVSLCFMFCELGHFIEVSLQMIKVRAVANPTISSLQLICHISPIL